MAGDKAGGGAGAKSEADDVEQHKMPLIEHLIELRRRLTYSIVAFLIVFLIGFYFANPLFDFLVQPLANLNLWEGQEGKGLIFTALHEKFFTNVKVAFFFAAFASFPLVSTQVWLFVAPGLYKKERGAFLPFLIITPFLFFLGAAMVYYMVMPVAWKFFAGFQRIGDANTLAVELLPKVSEYLSLSMHLIFAFGIAFETPVVVFFLAWTGIVPTATMRRSRRYVLLATVVTAAILTPPDVISQMLLAGPMYLLFELGLLVARLAERKPQATAAG